METNSHVGRRRLRTKEEQQLAKLRNERGIDHILKVIDAKIAETLETGIGGQDIAERLNRIQEVLYAERSINRTNDFYESNILYG